MSSSFCVLFIYFIYRRIFVHMNLSCYYYTLIYSMCYSEKKMHPVLCYGALRLIVMQRIIVLSDK